MASVTRNQSGRLVLALLTILAGVGGLNLPAASAASGDIYHLGTFGGTNATWGNGINDAGEVAGSSPLATGRYRAFRYTGGVMQDLGILGGVDSRGRAINSTGQVAGESATGYGDHAFRYTGTPGAGGVMADLGTLGGASSYGYGINGAGEVTGTSRTTAGASHAFRYIGTPGAGGVMVDLGTFLGGSNSVGQAINDAGQVTGYSDTGEFTQYGDPISHAFLYVGTPGTGGVMADLGTLGGTDSFGYAVNNAGQVAGRAFTSQNDGAGNPVYRAFLYTGTPGASGTMIDLGTLGGLYSDAAGINDAGFVVGSAYATSGPNAVAYATLWLNDAAHTPVNLDAWLNATDPTIGAYWTLGSAKAINNNGLITGTGYYNDGPGGLPDGNFAYILDASNLVVPEPGVTADFDLDGDVDLTDFAHFQACFNGPNRPPAQSTCGDGDLDHDSDVDLSDFAIFQGCFNGPNRPAACV